MTKSVAYVMLEDGHLPNMGVLIEALRVRHPGLRWESTERGSSEDADGPMFIRAGDHLVAILLMPAPLPFDQQLWERTSSVWPDAFHAARRHRTHLIISTMGSAEKKAGTTELGLVESAPLTTAVVGGVLEAQRGCLGVVWCGNVARSPEMWLEQSRRSFTPFPDHPFGLWMEIVPFRCGETVGAYTVGLSAFTGREIEFEVDGLDERVVIGRVAQLASHLIANGIGTELKNGAVYEADSEIDHRVAVLHRNSRFNIGPVITFSSVGDRLGKQRTYEIIPTSIARNHPLLVMLGKAGLFDPASPRNRIQLRPDHYVSEVRLESYDGAISGALSDMLASDAYFDADAKARRALATGDVKSAKLFLLPFSKEVDLLQSALKLALTLRDAFMFLPAPPRRL